MAQSEATTTRPPRKRVPAKTAHPSTTAETPPVETPTVIDVAVAPVAVVDTDPHDRIPVILEFVGRSKNYDKWTPVKGSPVSGTIYAPPGALAVKALLIVPKVS